MAEDYRQLVINKAYQYGVNPNLALAQIGRESSFNPRAVSPAGAKGLAQFMPATAARFGLTDPFDPVASMDAWGQYMISMLAMFNGRYDLALAGYISGENRAEYAAATRESRPINYSALPASIQSTVRNYVTGIMNQAGITYDFSGQAQQIDGGPIIVTPGSFQETGFPTWLIAGFAALLIWAVVSD